MTNWQIAFSVGAYVSAGLCIYAAVRLYPEGWMKVVREILLLVLFVVGYWLLESYATYAGPYYFYAPGFWDTVPYFPYWSSAVTPIDDPCCSPPEHAGMSLSVPVMEGSLTFAMMWTARLLAPKLYLLYPFLTALAALSVDAFLDPVAAKTFHCDLCGDGSMIATGLGFWEWQVHEDLGYRWFGIPLFNYAAWYCAPIALVALALLLKWAQDFGLWLQDTLSGGSSMSFSITHAIIFFAFTLLFAVAPGGTGTIEWKGMAMLLVIILTVRAVIRNRSTFVRTNPYRWEFILPQLIFHGFGVAAFLFSGKVDFFPLVLAGIVIVPLGVYYAFSPYTAGAPETP